MTFLETAGPAIDLLSRARAAAEAAGVSGLADELPNVVAKSSMDNEDPNTVTALVLISTHLRNSQAAPTERATQRWPRAAIISCA